MPARLPEDEAIERRIVLALAKGAMTLDSYSATDMRLSNGDRVIKISQNAMAGLAARRLIVRERDRIALSRDGAAWARRLRSTADPFRDQHADIEMSPVDGPDGWTTVCVNMAESPLSQLMRRKNQDGAAFLSDEEFAAGEKLRADYTRGQLLPRTGANWESPISTGKRGAPASDLTDGAIAARRRVEQAIEAVGPELSGVLIDVCCFLKGLETVERERRWPARSAKLLLKSALGCLARHYSPGAGKKRSQILSWGAAGYRPSL